jgi:hypothetical protein
MDLVISPTGEVRCVYGEDIDLHQLGTLDIRRASYVEPIGDGRWLADLSPVGGPVLGPFDRRSEALVAELAWLEAQWLTPAHQAGSSFLTFPLPDSGQRSSVFPPQAVLRAAYHHERVSP